MRTFKGREGFAFLDERELRLRRRWFHYSTQEAFSQFFRSPDWRLWQEGRHEDAIRLMLADADGLARNTARARTWSRNGVRVVRAQVIDLATAARIEHPVNYLLTYLEATHPGEDCLVIDQDKAAAAGIALPDLDFLIHDDDLVMTKYVGEPGIPYRDCFFNDPAADDTPPTRTAPTGRHADHGDQAVFQHLAAVADLLLARRDEITFTGRPPGLELLDQVRRRPADQPPVTREVPT